MINEHAGPSARGKIYPHQPRKHVDIRKVACDTVPYGDCISRNGRTAWAGYDGDGTLVCVAATADEARRKYLDVMARRGRERSEQQANRPDGSHTRKTS